MTRIIKKSIIPASKDVVFAWHKRPGAFYRLTPLKQRVIILEKKGTIENGDRLSLKIYDGPIGQNCVYEHFDYIEGKQFCDRQIKGPFVKWRHRHQFSSTKDNQCEMNDELEYELPWFLKFLDFRIQRKLEELFEFRHMRLKKDLLEHQGVPSMKILIAGSSGLIGSALRAFLQTGGHDVVRLLREKGDGIVWDPQNQKLDPSEIEGFDAVINLAGESIADSRWTEEKKKKIRESRIQSTKLLSSTLKQLDHPPKVFINASAMGYYGNVPDGEVTESRPAGEGFLASVCEEWEAATDCLMGEDIRIIHPRIGIVLSPKGGALKRMLTPFKLGLAGVIGSGKQMMSWIDIEDLIRAFYFCLNDPSIHGPVNFTAPNPVTNRQFTKTLGKTLYRPTIIPMPAFIARTVFGEMADEMLLSGAKVLPEKLLSSGFEFQYPTLKESLKHLL